MTGEDIDFYFDFISPYAYFASTRIEQLARRHGRGVRWRVFRLGVTVIKVMGLKAVLETPLKGPYSYMDIQRMATLLGVPFTATRQAVDPATPGSAFWAAAEIDPLKASDLAARVLHAYWTQAAEIDQLSVLAPLAQSAGIDPDRLLCPAALAAGRQRLKAETDAAIQRGVFGSPTFVVGDELIWGADRIWMLDHFLEHGQVWAELPAGHPAKGQ
ncbi:MAG: hypothetical protein A3H34_04785 [Betaproteobacteria bacterium RIFCSPLOWO2_02_FULL_67_19]|nr:MAG: hypothetical protein A3H34_04785 [Betaproteobacteria bacterium RIFCSPLOWO2_02_FULL_67_19]